MANHVSRYFRDFGHAVFTDVNNIELGEDWSNTLETNISNCDIFVIIITNSALRSLEIEKEVLQAQRQHKRIIPCFDSGVRSDDIKWNLTRIQGVDFSDKYELARNLFTRIGKGQIKKRDPGRKKLKVFAVVIAIMIVVVVIFGTRSYYISAYVDHGDAFLGKVNIQRVCLIMTKP